MQVAILVLITLVVLFRLLIRKNKPVQQKTFCQQSKYSKTREEIQKNVALANDQIKPTAWSAKPFIEKILEQKEIIAPYQSGNFQLISTQQQLEDATKFLQQQQVIGVDVEYHAQTSYDGFICLIQISAYINDAPMTYIFDTLQDEINKNFRDTIGLKVLANSNILKIMHGCLGSDIGWILKEFGVKLSSIYDTQEFQKNFLNHKELSLAKFWQQYCTKLFKVSKTQKSEFQKSDWSARPLTPQQLDYAAHDTYFLLHIVRSQIQAAKRPMAQIEAWFNKFNDRAYDITYTPQQSRFDYHQSYKKPFRKVCDFYNPQSDSFLLIELLFKDLYQLRETIAQERDCSPLLIADDQSLCQISLSFVKDGSLNLTSINCQYDELFRNTMAASKESFVENKELLIKGHTEANANTLNSGINSHVMRQMKKDERKVTIMKTYSCKKNPYENGRLLAPDGKLLSYTDIKKGQWYVTKGLAKIICEEPFTVQLNFEPSGRSLEGDEDWVDDSYYSTDRENKCVCCGEKENFSRFHVVPTLYRTHFPDALKSHRSHDVLLLCFECHNKAQRGQDVVKHALEKRYNCPLNQISPYFDLNLTINTIRKSANSLNKINFGMPPENAISLKCQILNLFKENLKILTEYLPANITEIVMNCERGEELPDQLIDFCNNFQQLRLSNQMKLSPHGRFVVEQIEKEGGLTQFIREWRQNFLEFNQPKFLPKGWRVDHKFERSFGEFSAFNDRAENNLATEQSEQ